MSGNRRNKRTEAKEAIRLAAARNRQGDDLGKKTLQFSKKQWCTIIFLVLLFGGSLFEVAQGLSDVLGSYARPMTAIALIALAGAAMSAAWQNREESSQSQLQIRPGKEIKQEWQWPNKSAREDGVLRKSRDQKKADRETRKNSPDAERRDSVLAEDESKRHEDQEVSDQVAPVHADEQVQTAWGNLWENLEAWTGMAQ